VLKRRGWRERLGSADGSGWDGRGVEENENGNGNARSSFLLVSVWPCQQWFILGCSCGRRLLTSASNRKRRRMGTCFHRLAMCDGLFEVGGLSRRDERSDW
jgi:hypothetical protein